jgi:Caspase domain
LIFYKLGFEIGRFMKQSVYVGRCLFILGIFIVMLISNTSQAQPKSRHALVLGNAAYPSSALRNPTNDARLMETTLKQLGFQVTRIENVGFQQMRRSVREFGDRARSAEVAMIFFAGHGMQLDGENYLLPVDAVIEKEADLMSEGITASSLLRQVESTGARVGLVILDACRSNPFQLRSRSVTRGLARMDVSSGSIVAYAAQPNSVADDGTGSNGLYTSHLSRHLLEKGLDIREVFNRTGIAVEAESKGRQRPREDIGLRTATYLNGTPQIAAVQLQPPPTKPTIDYVAGPFIRLSDGTSRYHVGSNGVYFFKACAEGLVYTKNKCEGVAAKLTLEEAFQAAAKANQERFGGFSNWRVPTNEELLGMYASMSTLEASKTGPPFGIEKDDALVHFPTSGIDGIVTWMIPKYNKDNGWDERGKNPIGGGFSFAKDGRYKLRLFRSLQ